MQITMIDFSIAFDGSSPNERALGGAEKAFARLAAALAGRGHTVAAINRCANQIRLDDVDWLPWDSPRPPETDVLMAFRRPMLLDEVDEAAHRTLWLWDGPKLLDRPEHKRVIERQRPTLVFTGNAHRDALNSWRDLRQAVIVPGVDRAYTDAAEDEIGIPNPVAVLTTHPLHGLTEIVRLWSARIHPERPEARLRVYSAGLWRGIEGDEVDAKLQPAMDAVRAAAENGVEVRPPLADPGMAAVYRRASAHLYPVIKGEMYGSTLAESQAAGTPAVVHASAGASRALSERVRNGQTGYMAPDDDAFVNLTLGLLEPDSAMYQSLGREARATQGARGWDQAAIEFEALWK